MDIGKQFGTDKAAEIEGVWVPVGDTARIKVARQGNPDYNKVLRKKRAPYSTGFRGGTIPEDVALRIYRETLAETILLDWEGIEENGKPVKYSRENALRLLTDYPDFAEMVASAAGSMETFRREAEEVEAKN